MSLIYADYLYKDVIVTSMRGGVYKGHISDLVALFVEKRSMAVRKSILLSVREEAVICCSLRVKSKRL